MTDHFQTVREALKLATDGPIVDRDGMMAQALKALAAIESDHYSAADMADAQAKAFRAGVASVTAGQEPVAFIRADRDGEELVWCKDEELDGVLYAYEPLYAAAPVAQQPNEWKEAVLDWLANTGKDFPIDTPPSEIVKWLMDYERELAQQPQAEKRCQYCDGSGDVHGFDGEWRGECHCQKQPQAEAVPEMHDALCPALTGGDCTCTPPAIIDKAWAQFCGGIGRGPDAPYPGMIEAFEAHYGQTFTDKDWREETGVWAAAWKAAKANGEAAPQQAEAVPSDVGQLEYRGNSVAYIHQKMTAYRGAIDAAWQAMRDAGHPPDGCTPLAQAITKALAPQQAEAVPSDVERDAMVEAACDAVAAALRDAYDCGRVWSAWSYGTMGPDDFSQVSEDCDRVREIAVAAIDAALAAAPKGGL